jgi:hypothetical protein
MQEADIDGFYIIFGERLNSLRIWKRTLVEISKKQI